MDVFWKYLERFVRNKSMHDGLFGFLGYIHSLYISEVRDYEMRDKTNV